jgi:CP family cyanate transporter-like MFS transporter
MAARDLTPTGGRTVWLPVAGAAVSVGVSYLTIFSVPPLITTFVDDLGLSHAQAGALMSVCLGGFLLASLASGRLAARFGPPAVLVAALVLCGAATAAFALTDVLPVWLLCRAAIGAAGGLIYAPGITLVTSRLPPERANVGVGVFLCGLSIGGTVAFFATRLLADAAGWRWPSFAFGAVAVAGAAIVALLTRSARRPTSDRPRAAGVPARETFTSPPFRLLLGCLFVALFVAYGVFTWIPPYLDESAGLSTAQISFTSALMTLAGIPATFGIGWLADRSGRPLGVAAAALTLPMLLAVFALADGPSHAAETAVATLAALGISGGLGPLYALPPLLFGQDAATASGLAAASAMGGAVTSTYLGGWIVGATDSYSAAFWIYAAAGGAVALLLVPLVARSARRGTDREERAPRP